MSEDTLYLVGDDERIEAAREAALELLRPAISAGQAPEWGTAWGDSAGAVHSYCPSRDPRLTVRPGRYPAGRPWRSA